MTPKRALRVDWLGREMMSVLFAHKQPIEVDDVTGIAQPVAFTDEPAPSVIHHAHLLWRRATSGPGSFEAKAADIAYRCLSSGTDAASEYVAFGDDLYQVRVREPAIAITYNPYHSLLRMSYPEEIFAARVPSDPPEIYFRLDEYTQAEACFSAVSRQLRLRFIDRCAESHRVVAPDLLGDQLWMTLRSMLPTIVTSFHRRLEILPHHMIQDWISLRASSSLPEERLDVDELAALLGRLSRSGLDVIERDPEGFGPNDWLRRASQYAMILQLRLRPAGDPDRAIDLLSEVLS